MEPMVSRRVGALPNALEFVVVEAAVKHNVAEAGKIATRHFRAT
jgi:hypothetical protein